MLQKMEQAQLQQLSLEELTAHKASAEQVKATLEAAKVKGGAKWTDKSQEELDDIVMYIVDLDELLEAKAEKAEKAAEYEVAPGTEDMIHLLLVKGKQFSQRTGKEISKPQRQMFTFSEWQLFKINFAGLGYEIVKVLHDKYNDAHKYVAKETEE